MYCNFFPELKIPFQPILSIGRKGIIHKKIGNLSTIDALLGHCPHFSTYKKAVHIKVAKSQNLFSISSHPHIMIEIFYK